MESDQVERLDRCDRMQVTRDDLKLDLRSIWARPPNGVGFSDRFDFKRDICSRVTLRYVTQKECWG